MRPLIDINFDVYSDTPTGKDPDSFSPTLRSYHKTLWSKALPQGNVFTLFDEKPGAYLYHSSPAGEYYLSSDSIGHTYRYVKAMAPIVEHFPERDMARNFQTCSTIGAYVIFPSKMVDRKPTINAARGLNNRIKDRFDLTLECIRRHYQNEASPLTEVLARYSSFFGLFESFRGYVDFFLFQDLTMQDTQAVKTFLPFAGFETPPLPANLDEYQSYMHGLITFINKRNARISDLTL